MTLLIPYASLESSPWKNGAGSTIEIASAPPGASFGEFDWRISLATIAADGPFSTFAGVERTLALVDGPGITLDTGDGRFFLDEDDPVFEFDGGSQIQATLNGAPTTDFNVMTRRGRCSHKLGRRSVTGVSEFAPRSDVTVLFLAEGDSLSVRSDAERIGLVRYDAVVFGSGTVWYLEAARATVIVVDIAMS